MDKTVLRYYKKQMSGGKSAAARAADFIMLRVSGFFALYIFFMFSFKRLLLSAILALLCVVAGSVILRAWQSRRLTRYADDSLERIKTELMLERLVLMDYKSYDALISDMLFKDGYVDVTGRDRRFRGIKEGKLCAVFAFACHPSEKTGLTPVLEALRSTGAERVVLLSPSGFADDVSPFIERTGRDVAAVSQEDFLAMARATGLLIDDETARQAAHDAMKKTVVSVTALKDAVVARAKSRAYLFCGIVAALWTLVAGFSLLYPILALVCFGLAFAARRRSE